MKRYLLPILIYLMMTVPGSSASAQIQNNPIDLELAKEYFDKAKELSDIDGGKMWGHELYGPLMFVDPVTKMCVTNMPDKFHQLNRQGDVYVGRLPESIITTNTSAEWSGVLWSMATWPLPSHSGIRNMLMMHELFHSLQPKLKIDLALRNNHHLDFARGRIWMRLEWRALAVALKADDPTTSEALKDALVFREHRRRLSGIARREERDLELNEGLAEYTGIKLSGLSEDQQIQYVINAFNRFENSPNIVRSFAYASGPPYCYLLDTLQPNWRKTIKQSSDLGLMVRKAIRFRFPQPIKDEAYKRAEKYDGETIIAEETKRDEERESVLTDLRKRFVDGPVVTIPMRYETRFMFDSFNMYALLGVGTVYNDMRVTGDWGQLQSNSGVLLIEDKKTNGKIFRIPAPESTNGSTIKGDGWTLQLKNGWALRQDKRKGDFIVTRAR